MAKNWERNLHRELKKVAFKEFEGWGTNDFISHILELREEIAALEGEGKKAQSGNLPKESLNENKFNPQWSYPTKIHFLLELNQKPLTSTDLDQMLLKLDSHYKLYKIPRNNLTTSISRAVKSGRIKKIKEPGIKLKFYALPEWVDKEGILEIRFHSQIRQFY
jgi:hypothetical protein